MILEVLLATISAGVLVVLIAWGVSCTRRTEEEAEENHVPGTAPERRSNER